MRSSNTSSCHWLNGPFGRVSSSIFALNRGLNHLLAQDAALVRL